MRTISLASLAASSGHPRGGRAGAPVLAGRPPAELPVMATPARSSAYAPAPDETEWAERLRELRPHQGAQQWMSLMAERMKDRWTSALGPPPPGVRTHPGRAPAGASRATSREPDEADPEAGGVWVYRSVPDARRWVQALDTHPAFGEARFLWYVLGRPVLVGGLVMKT